ncbi:MAG: ABC transporter substrate-binding protein [Xenococcaceae cyanobacterium]
MWDQKINLSKKNIVLFFYVIILSLIGPLIFWVSNKENNIAIKPNRVKQEEKNANRNSTRSVGKIPQNIQNRLSLGEKILVSADTNPTKKAAIASIVNENYNDAHTQFLASLQVEPNDPEALIYANNAIAALQKNEIRIGVSVPIGGNLNVAKEILRGVAQAQQEVNRSGGINGRFIKIQIANDDNNVEIGKQIANAFVRDERIIGVIGHNASEVSIATAPIYEQSGLVMISPTSAAKHLTQMGSYIFRTTPSTRKLADKLAEYTTDYAKKSNIAICSDSESSASQSFKEEFIYSLYERRGKIARTKCDFASPNFDPYQITSKAVSDGADALLLIPSIYKINQAIETARANQGRLTLLGNHSLNTYVTLKEGGQDVNGMVSVAPWYPEDSPLSYFSLNARKLWGGDVNWRTAMAYDATKALIDSFKLGSSREDVRQSLLNPSFYAEGATNEVTFIPSGDRNMQGTLVRVQPGSQSGVNYTFKRFETPVRN